MELELIEEQASFVCAGVKYAFRRWARDEDRVLPVSSPASSSCSDAAAGGGRCGSFDAMSGGGPSRFSDLPAVDGGCSGASASGSSSADAVPVVLLHGFAQSSASWGEVAALLLEFGTFTSVYALDFTDHGKSLRASRGKSLDTGFGKSLDAGCGKGLAAGCIEGPDSAWDGDARFDDAHPDDAHPDGAHPDGARFDGLCAYEMDAVCEAVRSFVELVACREGVPPMLVGYSMGGRIALECLVRYGASARRSYDGVSEGCLAGGDASSERESSDERGSSGDRGVLNAWRIAGGRDALGDRNALGVLPVSTSRGASGGQDVSSALSVSALVLESAGLGPADEDTRLGLKKRNVAWARRLREEGVPAFMDYWRDLPLFESQRVLSPKRQAVEHAARLANDAEALARTFEGVGAHRQSDEAASLAALRDAAAAGLPVLYLAGSLDAKYRAVAQRVAQGCRPAPAGASIASGVSPRALAVCRSTACQHASVEHISQKPAVFCRFGTLEEGISADSQQSFRACENSLCVSAGHRREDAPRAFSPVAGAGDAAKKMYQIAKNGQKTGNMLNGQPSELSTGCFSSISVERSVERSAKSASAAVSECDAGCVSRFAFGRFAGFVSEAAAEGVSEGIAQSGGFCFTRECAAAEGVSEGIAQGLPQCAFGDASRVAFGDASGGIFKGVSKAAFEGVPEVVVVEGVGHNIHLEEPEEFARILGCFVARAGLAR